MSCYLSLLWSCSVHGLFCGASQGVERVMLVVQALLALVPKNFLLEYIVPFAVLRVLVHVALVLRGLRSRAWLDGDIDGRVRM